jgi:putative addiction module component (TIGR02574 family)
VTTALREKIMALPVDEKLELVEEIWNSITKDQDSFPLSDEHARIIDERTAQHEARPDQVVSVEDAIQAARKEVAAAKKKPRR